MGAPSVWNPQTETQATALLAEGKPQRFVARILGVGRATVARLALRIPERIDALRKRLQEGHTEKVLERQGAVTGALLDIVEDAEAAPKDRIYAARVAFEGAGVIGGGGAVHVHGDVTVNALQVDASRHVDARGMTQGELRAAMRALDLEDG